MPDKPSITIVKTFPYRGNPEEYSNTYHFDGTTPGTAAAWKALGQAIWDQERTFLSSVVKLQAVYGYVAGNESSVYQLNTDDSPSDATVGALSGATVPPGDVAMWVRWKTDQRTSKGKPIYLRKYFHGFAFNGPDSIGASSRTPAIAYAGKMTDGSLPGGFKICAPQGALGGATKVPTFTTTRTLKRRGKDPS